MNIIIADDNRTFREALSIFVEKEMGYKVISISADGNQLVNNSELSRTNLLLIDINMPVYNGVQALSLIHQEYPFLNAIAITMYNDKAYLVDLLGNGFKGCVFKDTIYKDLPAAINTVNAGGYHFPDNIKEINNTLNI